MNTITGQIIKGYELRDQIGAGGFGVVYKAYQPTIDREVAIKVILSAYSNQPEFIRRFENEAQIVARLEHPYIVPLFDFWREPDRAFLVMRYYPSSLHDRVQQSGPLTLAAIKPLVEQIASALALAHRNGVIHRDLKPENIMLDQEGNGYLTDFGIAASLKQDQEDLPVTSGFTGSFEYTAPELLRNQPPVVQSDIYSLGYTIHRALSGKPAITETSINRWVKHHLSESIPPDEHIPPEVFNVLRKATAKSPDERYPTVLEFVAALRTAISGQQSRTESIDLAEQDLTNPYKGLRAFEESDVDDFFGRAALTQHLIERLTEETPFKRFLAVVGPSGSGKSSVVKAGLIPALRHNQLSGSEQWYFAEMTPGDRPYEKLAAALLGVAGSPVPELVRKLEQNREGFRDVMESILPPEQELLLIIDQFEELFILSQADTEIASFLDSLYLAVTAINSHVRVVITLRADFYDRPLLYGDFAELIRARSEVIVPLSAQEFEQAIRGPAQRVGLAVEPQLVAAIVSDVRGEPGALPLLQYVLTELFERREGNTLTLNAYQASGGALQSLAKRAEEIYLELAPEKQPFTRQIFLRMVTLGEGVEDTRRRVLFSELSTVVVDRAVLQDVLDAFGKYRLLTFEHDLATREPSVEIAHEALIREWTRLRKWLEDSRSDVRMQRSLAAVCQEWIDAGRQSAFLLSRGRLAQFEEWVGNTTVALTTEEQKFVEASLAERDRLAALETERQMHEIVLEKRARRGLQMLAALSIVGAIVGFLLTAIALNQRADAIEARHESDDNAITSHEIALLSEAQLALYRDHDTDLAIALAMEAYNLNHLPDQEIRVLTETMYAPGTRHVFIGHAEQVRSPDLNQDGTRLLSAGDDRVIHLWDVETGKEIRQFEGHTEPVHSVAYSPNDRLFASASEDNTVRIWDAETGDVVHVLQGNDDFFTLAFHPDGQVLATGSKENLVQLWSVETGELLSTLGPDDPATDDIIEGHHEPVLTLAFSPGGDHLLSGGRDNLVLHWDWQQASIVRDYEFANIVYLVAFGPDGQTFFVGALPKDVTQWDLESGEELIPLKGHTAGVYGMSFSPDGQTALTASQDNSVRLWNLETGAEIHRFIGHSNEVIDVEFHPNGRQFVSASFDGTLRLWDIETDQMLRQIGSVDGVIYQVRFNADSTRLLSASGDYTVRLWDVETGEMLREFGPDDPETEAIEGHNNRVMSADFSPDGKTILAGDYDSNLILWDAETGEILRIFGPDNLETEDVIEGHTPTTDPTETILAVWYVTFSPDGETAFSSAFDKTIIRWDLATGEVIHRYEGHTEGVLGVTPIGNGERFLSHSWDKTIILWDTETGEIIRRYEGHDHWIWSVALSPDETAFLSASADGTIILWDIETGHALRHFMGHEDAVLSVDFSPDGQWAISSGRDNLVKLWNLQTGEWVRHYGGHTTWVRSVDYSPVSDIFVTGDNNGNILLWKRRTLDEMTVWAEENRYVRALTCPEREFYRVEPYCDAP